VQRLASPDACATTVTESIPHVMRLVRAQMRKATALPSVAQVRALGHVKRRPGISITDVAQHLGVAKATASVLVETLIGRGLLGRAPRKGERRAAALTITPRGDRLLREARASTRERIAAAVAPLSARERGAIVSGLELLGRALDVAEEREHLTARKAAR
jgi:DNA-binding MarR family transcriptional regulator